MDVVELVDLVEDLPPDLVEELPPVDVLPDASDCSQNNCSADATCTNTDAGFTCTCNPPLVGDGLTCVEAACCGQCPGAAATCDPNSTCTSQSGSYDVCTCNTGYTGDGVTCADLDECTTDTDNCAAGATCTNTAGSFSCACNEGYSGDGVTCADDDECTLSTDNCSAVATCTNTDGGFTCECNVGYSGTGVTCTDVDECIDGTDNCAITATCGNTVGSFTCACNAGYSGDGVTCANDGYVTIPSGSFTMGSPVGELGREIDEIQHAVTLTRSFVMKKTEVTQGEWQSLMGNNPSNFSLCGVDCPVDGINWYKRWRTRTRCQRPRA